MKFGKEFKIHLEETLPEWRDKFLCYKPLKKLLKSIPNHYPLLLDRNGEAEEDEDAGVGREEEGYPPAAAGGAFRQWIGLEEWFIRVLEEELEKFNDFYVDKEEDFIIRLQELKERIERARAKSSKNEVFTSESEFSEEMLEIRKAFVTIHGEMVLLKNYSSLNFAGLVKILKKYDKRTGGLLRLPFTQRALHQPFFTTEPLTRLVRECESNLELLFPLEAEVVESSPQDQTQTDTPLDTNPVESSSSAQEDDTMDVYRSTLAALRALQGLRRASSTYNPLSLAHFFHAQDSGAVTAEDSVSNSSTSLQNEEVDQDGGARQGD